MNLKAHTMLFSSGNHIIIDEIQGAFSYTPMGIKERERPGKPSCLPGYVRIMNQQVGIAF